MKFKFFLLPIILILIKSTSPPEPEPALKLIPGPAIMESPNNKNFSPSSFSSLKKLEENTANTIIENSTVVIKFLEDNKIEEHHQIIFRAENLPSGNFYSSKNFIIGLNEGQDLENINNICEKVEKSEDNPENNNCEVIINKYEDFYMFLYRFKLYNNEHIIINYSFNITKSTPEILYRQETVIIPDFNKGFCDYTFIIPEGFISLGLKDDSILTKKTNQIYTYYDKCPSYSTEEIIRFSPKENAWKANITIYTELAEGFTDDVNMTFPKYYQGGKLNTSYYLIFPLENDTIKKSDFFLDDLYYKVKISASNKQKIGIKLYAAFTNNLYDSFNFDFPEKYYLIDNSTIDPDIKSKANQIILDDTKYPGFPNYYKLGKFVNTHLDYNEKKISKNYSARELLYLTEGVSNHFTLLYNALLNSIGIQTLTIVGWAFKKDDVTGVNGNFNHTWTAALINGEWMELDASWDLFEGVPAGHVLKTFFSDNVNYSFNEIEGINPLCEQLSNIYMITNISELEDPFPEEIENISYAINIRYDEETEYSEKISSENEQSDNEEEFGNNTNKIITNINETEEIDIIIEKNDTKEISEIIINDNNSTVKEETNTYEEKYYEGEKADNLEKHSFLLVFLILLILL